MKKMLFIMNPYAGQRKANRFLTDILGLFNKSGYEVVTYMTAGTGDAVNIARDRAQGMDLVVCCGGDGTLNETISGLYHAGLKIPVGYIPAGSTNDFASSLKLSGNIMQAAQDIMDGEPIPYDMGRFGDDRYFTYVASFGAFTKTSYNTPQSVKNALGHTAYLLDGIQELSQIRKAHVRMELDDQSVVEDDFIFGCISNSTSIGGIMTLDPRQVDMSDGLMEVFLVRSPKNFTEIAACIQALQSQQYNNCNMITFCSARKIKVVTQTEMTWTLDGERADAPREFWVENLHLGMHLMQRRKEDA